MRTVLFCLLLGILISACHGNGPVVDVCLSFPEKGGFVCVDRDQKPYFLAYSESLKYVAFSPDDAQKLVESCGLSGHNKAMVTAYLDRVERVASRSQ